MDLRDQQERLADEQPLLDSVRRVEQLGSHQLAAALAAWSTAAAAQLREDGRA
jgi:hypothetical protein